MPISLTDIRYDAEDERLSIADGILDGVQPEVWLFEVSGMQVLRKWLGYRCAKPAGRAASSSSPLDHIRPESWEPEWSLELKQVVDVLTATLDVQPLGVALLDRICSGPLIQTSDLPPVPAALRKVPKLGPDGSDPVIF